MYGKAIVFTSCRLLAVASPATTQENQPTGVELLPHAPHTLIHLELGQKKSGVELLSHTLTYSIIVAGPLNNRVRDGNVCCKTAINTGKK